MIPAMKMARVRLYTLVAPPTLLALALSLELQVQSVVSMLRQWIIFTALTKAIEEEHQLCMQHFQ
jgi:hypothetical protein